MHDHRDAIDLSEALWLFLGALQKMGGFPGSSGGNVFFSIAQKGRLGKRCGRGCFEKGGEIVVSFRRDS